MSVIIVMLLLSSFGFNIIMLGDAIRRPSNQFRSGSKVLWVCVFLGLLLALLLGGILIRNLAIEFIRVTAPTVVGLIYHSTNRRGNTIQKNELEVQSHNSMTEVK